MALVQIQPSIRRKDEESGLTKLAQALSIAQGVLGTALSVPKFLQERELASQQSDINKQELGLKKEQIGLQKASAAREKAEALATIGSKYRPLQEGETATVDFGPDFGGQMILRNTSQEMSDTDKKLFDVISKDYTLVPGTQQSDVKFKIGGEPYSFVRRGDTGAEAADKRFKNESDLRKEFLQQSKEFIDQTSSYGRVVESGKDPSAAGDLALIFNYMKILDPGSTVREGEFANAQNAGGVSDRIQSIYNRVVSGERLSVPQRKDFLDRAKRLYNSAVAVQDNRENFYRNLSHEKDLDPTMTVPNLKVDFSAIKKIPKHLTKDDAEAF